MGYSVVSRDTTEAGGQRGRRRWPSSVYRSGQEPDVRFTLANERTFLAWIRTALGLVAAGVAVEALLDGPLAGAAAAVLVGLGALVPTYAFLRWAVSERALRSGRPLPAMGFGPAIAVGLTVAGVVLLVAVVA
jgi:putative membrane protein